MKTLYLHIGTPKTGSSALQFFCMNNREKLKEYGVSYPEYPFQYPNISNSRNAHCLFGTFFDINGNIDREEMKKRRIEGFAKIEQEFNEVDTVLLSDEGIWNTLVYKDKILRKIRAFCKKKGYELRVIIYLRKQSDYVVSYWRQKIRRGAETRVFDDFIQDLPEFFVLDYASHIKKIEKDVDAENIILRRYEKEAFYGGSIYKDFLHCINLDWSEEFQIESERVNTSLSNNFAEIKRIMNGIVEEEKEIDGGKSEFIEKIAINCSRAKQTKEETSMFSLEEENLFMKKYDVGNQWIADKYLGDGLPLFSTKEKNKPKWTRDNAAWREDFVCFVGSALLEQQKSIEKMNGSTAVQGAEKQSVFARLSVRKMVSFIRKRTGSFDSEK